MKNPKLPRPTKADYNKVIELEKSNPFSDEFLDLMNNLDWSAQIFEENGKYGLRSAIGELLLPAAFEDFMIMTGDVLRKGNRVVAKQNALWGIAIADGKGTWLVKPEYEYIGYPNHFTPLCKEGKWGVLNLSTGTYLIEPLCDMVHTDNGFMFVNCIGSYEKDGKTGVIHIDGTFTEAVFEDIDFDIDGPVKVMYNGDWGFINQQGQFTTNEEDDIWWFDVH